MNSTPGVCVRQVFDNHPDRVQVALRPFPAKRTSNFYPRAWAMRENCALRRIGDQEQYCDKARIIGATLQNWWSRCNVPEIVSCSRFKNANHPAQFVRRPLRVAAFTRHSRGL